MLRVQLLRCTHQTISASVRSCTVYSAAKTMAAAGDTVRIVVGYRDDTATLARQLVGQNVRRRALRTSVATTYSVRLEVDRTGTGQNLPFIQYIATLSIVQAVQELAQKRLQGSKIDVRIKWPNDIYSNGMKLGGVLCHSTYRQQDFHVVIGVGLNLDNSSPTTCINDLIKRRQSQLGMSDHSDPITREELLACLLTKLEAMTGTLASQGFGPLQEDYLQAWLHTNQQVTLIEDVSQKISLTVVGLTQYGYLRAVSNGEEYALHPDGNSLDFFKGLIRHKLE